jgi:hypothetical protein
MPSVGRAIITSEDFTTTMTPLLALIPRSSTASSVMEDVTIWPSPLSTRRWLREATQLFRSFRWVAAAAINHARAFRSGGQTLNGRLTFLLDR